MKNIFFLFFQSIVCFLFVDAGNITNQVVKTKGNHTCVLPTVVDKATSYWFLSNPQPGEIFEYCTLAHTGHLRGWPWCSYGKEFPEVENGTETFKWDYCTDYSWEFEGYKYTFKENNQKSYEEAKEFCKSQGGYILNFIKTKFDLRKVKLIESYKMLFYYEITPIYSEKVKTMIETALRPILAYYDSSSKKGFWLKTDYKKGEYIDFATTPAKSGSYDVERCTVISPHAGVSHVNCRKDDLADVVCQIPL